MTPVSHSVALYQAIRKRVLALDVGVDEATLSDTLEGLTNLHEVLAAVVRTALLEEAMADGLKGLIKSLQHRLDRLQQRASTRRQIARDAMVDVELTKVAAPDFTITIRPGAPAVVVIEEKEIPDAYWEPREPRLDRAHLLSDLKLGL